MQLKLLDAGCHMLTRTLQGIQVPAPGTETTIALLTIADTMFEVLTQVSQPRTAVYGEGNRLNCSVAAQAGYTPGQIDLVEHPGVWHRGR